MSSPAPLALPLATSDLARKGIPFVALAMLALPISPGAALVAGIATAIAVGNPWPSRTRELARQLLTCSVVGLGAGMNLSTITRVGLHGFGYTVLGIVGAMIVGTFLGLRLGVARDVSLLITVGTAICGGSAIAAIAPAIRAKDHDVSMALIAVFTLNSLALFAFPAIGHHLHLSQDAFGLWCALAIHDTSSVVGAAAQYGERALEVATATKLARALWIVPVTLAVAANQSRRSHPAAYGTEKLKLPWFVAGFLAAAAFFTLFPEFREFGRVASMSAHRLLSATLFLMGLSVSRLALRELGLKPFVQALLLWFVLAGATLLAIVCDWVT
ncbi:MAG TPA: putative sulfate exporter family transporter [Polyangiaceae bacterium]